MIGGNNKLLCEDLISNVNGQEVSVCNKSLYLSNPAAMSSNDYNTAEVTPGPTCKPNVGYTELGGFLNSSNTLNQADSEPCNCHGYGIRLAVSSEGMASSGARNFAAGVKGGAQSMLVGGAESPCEFRTASYAWDFSGDNDLYPDSTIMSIPKNNQGAIALGACASKRWPTPPQAKCTRSRSTRTALNSATRLKPPLKNSAILPRL